MTKENGFEFGIDFLLEIMPEIASEDTRRAVIAFNFTNDVSTTYLLDVSKEKMAAPTLTRALLLDWRDFIESVQVDRYHFYTSAEDCESLFCALGIDARCAQELVLEFNYDSFVIAYYRQGAPNLRDVNWQKVLGVDG